MTTGAAASMASIFLSFAKFFASSPICSMEWISSVYAVISLTEKSVELFMIRWQKSDILLSWSSRTRMVSMRASFVLCLSLEYIPRTSWGRRANDVAKSSAVGRESSLMV